MKYLTLVAVLAFLNIQSSYALNSEVNEPDKEGISETEFEIREFEKDLNLYIRSLQGAGTLPGGRFFLLQDVRREVSQTRSALKSAGKGLSKEEKSNDKEYLRVKSVLRDQQFLLNELLRLQNVRGASRFRSRSGSAINSIRYAQLLNAFLISMKSDQLKERSDIRDKNFFRVILN